MSGKRYVVIGAGAIGALLAAQLELAGRRTVLVARGAAYDAIRGRGVIVARPDVTETVPVDVASGPDGVTLAQGDVLVLAVKAQDAEAALADWAWRPVAGGGVAADLPIVTLQNGLATEDAALRRFSRVIGGTAGIAAQHLTPGEVASPSTPTIGLLWLGAHPTGTDPDQHAIGDDLAAAGYRVQHSDDIRAVKAWKLLGNIGNAIDLYDGTEEQRLAVRRLLVAEAEAAFQAARLPVARIEWAGAALDVRPVPGYQAGKLSTWQSFARGASSEIDLLNGEIVLLGRLHGVPTPVNAAVQRALGRHAASGDGVERAHPLAELLRETVVAA